MMCVDPASAADVFKNARRERSSGIMVKTTYRIEVTVEATGITACEMPILGGINQPDTHFFDAVIISGFTRPLNRTRH